MNLLTPTEYEILKLLRSESRGQYGLELVTKSGGSIKRGSVYVLLGRLEDKGYIAAKEVAPPPGTGGMPRRHFRLTGLGQKVMEAFEMLNEHIQGAVHAH